MSALPDLTKPLVKLSDPLGIMPKETQRKISDPLSLVTKPIVAPGPSQNDLYNMAQADMQARRASASNQSLTTTASLTRASIGSQTLGS